MLDAGLSTAAAIEAAGALLQERRDYAMQRQAIIATNAELRERELISSRRWPRRCAGAASARRSPN